MANSAAGRSVCATMAKKEVHFASHAHMDIVLYDLLRHTIHDSFSNIKYRQLPNVLE